MKIGSLNLAHGVTLAPMEEHTNLPYRVQARRFGASLVCGERTDAADVAARERRALRLLLTAPHEAPRAAQLSGADPAVLAEAARVVEELGYDLVDLNCDCPVRRLVERGEGGALMADPAAIGRLVAAMVKAVSIGVSVKLRSGPSADVETAVEAARQAEAAGAALVSVHARSVEQGYKGGPDWGVVARVKRAVRIPVLGGGGIREAADAARLVAETGADGVAIGRGSLGNPWIFRQTVAAISGSAAPALPTAVERGRALLELVEGEFKCYGPGLARRRLARTSCYFARFLPDFPAFRAAVQPVSDVAGLRRLVAELFR